MNLKERIPGVVRRSRAFHAAEGPGLLLVTVRVPTASGGATLLGPTAGGTP